MPSPKRWALAQSGGALAPIEGAEARRLAASRLGSGAGEPPASRAQHP
jgi:hypothetical protein